MAVPASGMSVEAMQKADQHLRDMNDGVIGPPQFAWLLFDEMGPETDAGVYRVQGDGTTHVIHITHALRKEWEPLRDTHKCKIVREGLRPGVLVWTDWAPVQGEDSPLYPIVTA